MSRKKHDAECQWQRGELGLSAEHAVAAPEELEREVDDALGLQPISIRLPKGLIEDMKLIAQKEGLGYQPLIRRVLLRFAEMEFRSMAHGRLASTLNQATDPEPEELRRVSR